MIKKYVLVTGCMNSGTSLVAAILGRHPEINMLFESNSWDVTKLYGKQYGGNKLCLHTQIRLYERANILKYAINKVVRVFPISRMSIRDYIDLGAKIIIVQRNMQDNIKSLMTRQGYTQKQAMKLWCMSEAIISDITRTYSNYRHISYRQITNDPKFFIERICDFLEIEFEQEMLNAQKYNVKYPNAKMLC